MAFAFVAAAHYNSASTNSATVAKPTGTADGDILFTLLKHTTLESPNSVPSGWTQVGTDHQDTITTASTFSLYRKIASSEPADYTWGWATSSRTGITVVAYRDGFDTGDPIDVVSDTAYVTNNTTLRAAGMTVTATDSPLIFFGFGHFSGDTTCTPATNPATFVEDVDTWNTDSRFSRNVSSVIWTGSGASGDMDATFSTSAAYAKHAYAVALNPATGGSFQSAWTRNSNQVIQ